MNSLGMGLNVFSLWYGVRMFKLVPPDFAIMVLSVIQPFMALGNHILQQLLDLKAMIKVYRNYLIIGHHPVSVWSKKGWDLRMSHWYSSLVGQVMRCFICLCIVIPVLPSGCNLNFLKQAR